jgi:hypothetical protein
MAINTDSSRSGFSTCIRGKPRRRSSIAATEINVANRKFGCLHWVPETSWSTRNHQTGSPTKVDWIGALPLKHIRTINPDGHSVELIRSATSDLNLTAAVALMVVVLVEVLEMRALGMRQYVKGLVIPNPLRWLELLVRPL